jgi:hypothetical protein
MAGDHHEIVTRAKQLIAESGLSWKEAWSQAQTELGEDDASEIRRGFVAAALVGCVVAAWVVGLPLTTIAVLTYWAVSDGQIDDLGALSFIFGGFIGLPLLIFAIGSMIFYCKKRGRKPPITAHMGGLLDRVDLHMSPDMRPSTVESRSRCLAVLLSVNTFGRLTVTPPPQYAQVAPCGLMSVPFPPQEALNPGSACASDP